MRTASDATEIADTMRTDQYWRVATLVQKRREQAELSALLDAQGRQDEVAAPAMRQAHQYEGDQHHADHDGDGAGDDARRDALDAAQE